MTTFIIFGVVMIIFGLVKNATNRQRERTGPSPRAQRLLQKLQTAQQQLGQNQYTPPAQYQPAPYQVAQYQPNQYQAPQIQYQQRPPQNHTPPQNGEIEKRVRELMKTGQEVAAIRLLCDEQDMGIIEAQEYARGLIAPPSKGSPSKPAPSPDREESSAVRDEETRYVGSAAFAESVFDLDRDENVWASGWVDKPEPEDRSDMDELWQTVRNNGRPSS